ncbi:Hypothetical predicted protein, partial [Paramuricea clavata]
MLEGNDVTVLIDEENVRNKRVYINEQGYRGCAKHYEQLNTNENTKVEILLFLVDKFGVSDKFVHEISMVFQDLPRSYVVKECRLKINSNCVISPTPGSYPGAQVSFKEKLANKLKLM